MKQEPMNADKANADKAAFDLPEHLAKSSIHKLYKLGRVLSEDITGTLYESGVPVKGKDAAVYVLAPKCSIASRKLIRIDHPNICRAHRVLTLKGGTSAVVIDRPEGEPILRFADKVDPFGIKESIAAVLQLLSALHGIHSVGKTARNLNVNNIFLHNDRNGNLRLKLAGIGIEGDGVNLNAPHYFSPERIMDVDKGDPRTDLWAAGAVLYHLAYGKPPFAAEDPVKSAKKSMLESPNFDVENRAVPDALVTVIKRALDKDERKRYQSASDMVGDLLPLRDTYNEPMSDEVTAALRNSYPPASAAAPEMAVRKTGATEAKETTGRSRTKDATIEYGTGEKRDRHGAKKAGDSKFFGTPISPKPPDSASKQNAAATAGKGGRKGAGTLLGIPAISVTDEANRDAPKKAESADVLSARSLLGSEEDIKQLESDLDFLENRKDEDIPTLVISGNNLAALVEEAEKSTPNDGVQEEKKGPSPDKIAEKSPETGPGQKRRGAAAERENRRLDKLKSTPKKPGGIFKDREKDREKKSNTPLFSKSRKQDVGLNKREGKKSEARTPADKPPAIRTPEALKLGIRHTEAGKTPRKAPFEKSGEKKGAPTRSPFAKPVTAETPPRPAATKKQEENPGSSKRTQLGMTVPEAFRKPPEKPAPAPPVLPTAQTAAEKESPPDAPRQPGAPSGKTGEPKPPKDEAALPPTPNPPTAPEIAVPLEFAAPTEERAVEMPPPDRSPVVPLLEPVHGGRVTQWIDRIKSARAIARIREDKRLLIGLSAGLLLLTVALVSAMLLSPEAEKPKAPVAAASQEQPTEGARAALGPGSKRLEPASRPTAENSASAPPSEASADEKASASTEDGASHNSQKADAPQDGEEPQGAEESEAAASASSEPVSPEPEEPAAPERVVINFPNVPETSSAKVDGEPVALPATLPFSKKVVRFAIEAEGYKTLRVGVVPDRDREVPIRMRKAPEKTSRPKHKKKKGSRKKRTGTLVSNPFTK